MLPWAQESHHLPSTPPPPIGAFSHSLSQATLGLAHSFYEPQFSQLQNWRTQLQLAVWNDFWGHDHLYPNSVLLNSSDPGPAASASPGNLLEVQFLGST